MVDRLVSNSEIQVYKQCRRRWMWGYRDRLVRRRENPTGAAAVGTRVHNALEDYYRGSSVEATLFSFDEVMATDLETYGEEFYRDLRAEGDLARTIVEGYFEWLEETGADQGLTVIAPESVLEAEMPVKDKVSGGNIGIKVKIDVRITRDADGANMVMDHKTVQEFTSPLRGLFLDEQMKMYLLLARLQEDGVRTDGAIYNMLRKTKRSARANPPFYSRAEARHNETVLNGFYQRLVAELSEIEKARIVDERELFPTPTRDCHWKCPFYSVCGLYDENKERAAERIEELFEVGNPDARYEKAGG